MNDKTRCFNCDCMEGMKEFPDKYFELAIVDPPYGIDVSKLAYTQKENRQVKQKNGRSSVIKKLGYNHGLWDKIIPTDDYFNELQRITKNQIIWGAKYYDCKWFGNGRIKWNKCVPEGMSFNNYEHALCSLIDHEVEFTYMWAGMMQGESINNPTTQQGNKVLNEKRIHPTHKPIRLYKWLLKNYAKEGDKILDTHGGSMRSVIACLDMGFSITCYELDTDYYNKAKERITNHLNQLNAFRPDYDIEFHDNSGVSRLRNQPTISNQEQKDRQNNNPIHRIDGLFHGDPS